MKITLDSARTAYRIGLCLALAWLVPTLGRAQGLPVIGNATGCAQALNALAAIFPKPPAALTLAFNEQALALCKRQNGVDNLDTLSSMSNLALDYRSLGRHEEARVLLEVVVRRRSALLSEIDPSILSAMNNLAASYHALERHGDVIALEEEILKRRRAAGEPAYPLSVAGMLTVKGMNNLADNYYAVGRYDRALALFEEIIRVNRTGHGPDHADTLFSMGNLGVIYNTVGRPGDAIVLQEQVLSRYRALLGPDNATTLIAMSNLAESYRALGRYADALALNEETLARRRKTLGADHLSTLASTNNLGGNYTAVGRQDEAFALFGEALQRLRSALGPDHPATLNSVNNLATAYGDLERLNDALPLMEETLRLRRAGLGENHPDTITSMNNLAWIFSKLGRHAEALALNDKTLYARRALLGADHPSTLTSQSNLAMSYRDMGRNEDAVKLNEQTVEQKRQKLGAEHPGTLLTLHNLAQNYYSVGRLDEIPALGRAYMAGAEKQRAQKGLSLGEQQTLFADYANNYRQFSRYFGRLARDKPPQDAAAKPQLNPLEEGERKALLQEGFEIADRAKARTLIESISRQTAARAGGLSAPDQQALERLGGEAAALEQALARQQDLAKPDGEILNSLQTRKREVDALYLKLQDKLKAAYPKYAQLLDVRFARPADARTLLGKGQQVVSYVLENNGNISVWLLDQSGEPRFIDLGQHRALSETLTRLRQQISASDERPVDRQLLQTLSAILIHPLLEQLSSSTRWIIIPDGDLALLPFDALLLPSGEPLINTHEISVVQSWSVYALLKQREADYSKLTRAKNLLAVGNAIYEAVAPDEAEKGGNTGARGRYRTSVAFPLELAGGLREQAEQYALQNLTWSNLPGTAREMEAVSRIFGTGVDTLSGALASEAQMQALNRSGKLTGYRYLLFSAHGYLATNPMLTSLVLSQHQRTPEADGYITAAEWPGYDMRSDLAVFSACDTGVGRTLPGEGVMGLPYALFVAGNKNTLLTLWPVDDAATAEFMQRFFARLAKGEAQISALIETKREFALHPQWSAPLYWAGFVLYGV